MRGLIPICEIQYLDYIYYGLEPICDDLASIHYRSKGGHRAPMIIRTRGHRLEGVWHSGSPMAALLGSVRGVYLLVPRNLTQAAGFYNTLFKSDNPAIVIETLNAYRQKEKMPSNIGEFTLPLGVPEILREGSDVTIVTYGAMCKICMEAASQLAAVGISCEVIDVQSLLPFDIEHSILKSLKKTGKIIFADEDVPGGATAYMMQQVIEVQNGYFYLDAKPVTVTAKEHRPAYSSDGDYFSKPNVETIFDQVYSMMNEYNPRKFPSFY
jgi:transketolase